MHTSAIHKLWSILAERPTPEDLASVVKVTPMGSIATTLNASLFVLATWATLGGREMAFWLLSTVCFSAFVLMRGKRARHVTVTRVSRRAIRMLLMTTFMLALPWTYLAISILPSSGEFERFLVLLVCAGVMVGAAVFLQRVMMAVTLFMGTINLGILVGCMIGGVQNTWAIMAFSLGYAVYVGVSAFASGLTARDRDRTLEELRDTNERLARANEKIETMARVDAVTGLKNRSAFVEDLHKALSQGEPRDLLMFDLDNFKSVNDSYGHSVGDALLTLIGRRITREVGTPSSVARLGGDEFAVLAPPGKVSKNLGETLVKAISKPAVLNGLQVFPATSIGITCLGKDGADATTLLGNADAALAKAKETGKGRVVQYDPKLGRMLEFSRAMARELEQTLSDDGLELYYQPKFDLATGALAGVEALLRWPHPKRGMLSPDTFLPVAEDRALLHLVTGFVFRRAAEDILKWRKNGIETGRVAINIHPLDLKTPGLLLDLIRATEQQGLGPTDLCLEITEGCFVGRGTAAASIVFDTLAEMGYSLSLDDFGTGHAALSHLRTLPVDEIKIDKIFIAGLGQDRTDTAIVSATMAIAKGMSLRCVAEGVETEEQLNILRELGAEQGQGFFWSPPMSAHAMAEFATRHEASLVAMRGDDLDRADGS